MNETALRQVADALGIRFVSRNGKWLIASCPFAPWKHQKGSDSNPSFGMAINESGPSAFNCYGCKSHGRISSMIRQLESKSGEDYGDLSLRADMMDSEVTLPDFEHRHAEEVVMPDPLGREYEGLFAAIDDRTPEALQYVERRGISKNTRELLGLGWDGAEQRVVFPVRDTEGRLYGFTGRTVLDEEDYPRLRSGRQYPRIKDYYGLKKWFFLLGAELYQPGKPIIVVEGLFGYAHLVEIGVREFANPMAMLGSVMTDGKANVLFDLGAPVYLLPDNDLAGDDCLWGPEDSNGRGAVDVLHGEVPLFVPEWPEGKDDPDQLTVEEVRRMVDRTPPYVD